MLLVIRWNCYPNRLHFLKRIIYQNIVEHFRPIMLCCFGIIPAFVSDRCSPYINAFIYRRIADYLKVTCNDMIYRHGNQLRTPRVLKMMGTTNHYIQFSQQGSVIAPVVKSYWRWFRQLSFQQRIARQESRISK